MRAEKIKEYLEISTYFYIKQMTSNSSEKSRKKTNTWIQCDSIDV